MAKKFGSDKDYDSEQLASQLRQPDGDLGKEVGIEMNKANIHICLNSYKLMGVREGHNVLEIGMGNGFFVKDLLAMARDVKYTGVDFSETMVREAKRINDPFLNSGKVSFEQASIENLPFVDSTFDRITTTNTLYFWPKPLENAKELFRLLKPRGKLLIAYRDKSCLDQIEFSKHGFSKYEPLDVEGMLGQAGFKELETQMLEEPELEFEGTVHRMEAYYTTGIK